MSGTIFLNDAVPVVRRFAEAYANGALVRARPLARAIRQIEEPVALVASEAELWSGEGEPRRRRRQRAPIRSSPRIESGGAA